MVGEEVGPMMVCFDCRCAGMLFELIVELGSDQSKRTYSLKSRGFSNVPR